MVKHKMILAVGQCGTIGDQGKIPWTLPYDLQRFKRLTRDSIVVMGRKTFDSLPDSKLPGRFKVVVSKSLGSSALSHDLLRLKNFEDAKRATDLFKPWDTAWWIGGQSCFEYAQQFVTTIELTRVCGCFHGDAKIDLKALLKGFELTSYERRFADSIDKHEALYETYTRN